MRRLWAVLAALLALLLPAVAFAAEPTAVDIGRAGFVDLRPDARLLVDEQGTRKLDDLRRAETLRELPAATSQSVHQGFTSTAYWLTVPLVHHGTGTVRRFVRVYPTVDRADVYLETTGGVSHQYAGRREPFTLRAVQDTNLLFPIELQPHEPARLFVRLAGSDVIRLDLELLDAETLAGELADRRLIWGVCYGIIAALCLYNLVLMFWLRDPAYLYYVLFQGALASLVAAFDHLTLQYLWPGSPNWSADFETIAVMVSIYGACGFVRSFLATPTRTPVGSRWLRVCQLVALVLLVGFPFTAWRPFAIVCIVFVLAATATTLTVTIISVRSGNPSARFLLGTWIILSMSSLTVIASALTTWDVRWPLEHLVRLSSVLEAVLLSFGLAYRINLLRRENEHMASDMLRQRVASLNNLVSGITHEIANPLHFVQSGAELLEARAKHNGADAGSSDALEIIKSGSKRIDLVVSNLRNQLSGSPSAFEDTNLTQVLRETLDLVRSKLDEQGIVVHTALSELPSVPSRPGELGQVFTNLLLNACQAMKGGGELWIETSADAAAIRVTITDSGPGVPAEHRAAIFDPFFTTRGPKEGAGLGLYVALQIMWNHAGSLELLPSERGAKFRVTVMRQQPSAAPEHQPAQLGGRLAR
jgi:signal transduction histidine kinase